MVLLKVFSKIFSNGKTIQRMMQGSKSGKLIQLKPKRYKESIRFEKNMVITGDQYEETVIEGLIIVPKNVSITIQNITIAATSQMYIEGDAVLNNCRFIGKKADVLVTVDGGKLNAYSCEFEQAKEMAVSVINNSKAIFENCTFHHNGKAQILSESSQICIEKCTFSEAKHAFLIKNHSLLQTKNIHVHHHSSTQIIVEESKYFDYESSVEHGNGIGLQVIQEAEASLQSTIFNDHHLSQISVQNSYLTARKCTIHHGDDVGIFVQDHGDVQISNCEVAGNKKANVNVTRKSRMNIEFSTINSSDGFGIQISKESIVNILETDIKAHRNTQLNIADHSICSIKKCKIKEGYHVGINIEEFGSCAIVESEITHNANSAITVFKSELIIFKSVLTQNVGNGIMAMSESKIDIDTCKFYDNDMPHVASKSNCKILIVQSEMFNGKSLFIVNDCELVAMNSQFYDSHNVQVEICDQSTARFEHCQIYNGNSYGVKVLRNSSFYLFDSQIFNHELSQIVANDSSVIIKNSELFDGCRNALFIQNHSEVYMQDCLISKHSQHQIWIDFESIVDLKSVQLTDGNHSDIFAQNQSSVYVSDSMIRNNKSRYNVQAVNFSKIELTRTIVENKVGDVYYSENHSFIKQLDC